MSLLLPDADTPAPARVLGIGGLLPFMGLAAGFLWLQEPRLLQALIGYGAVILSFVGALHWSHAMHVDARGSRAWVLYGWSVTPALIGWICLLIPPSIGSIVLAGALVLALGVDHQLAPHESVASWLLPLRRLLSTGAAASLLLAGVFA